MAVNSRAKGAGYEREIAAELRLRGLSARRGQQFSGANGDADVECEELKGRYHLELKRVERFGAADLYRAMEQSKRDARAGEVPVVIHRTSGEKSLVTMELDDWLDMVLKEIGGQQ